MGRWRVYAPNGDRISGSYFWYMGDAKQWLEGYVGRSVTVSTYGVARYPLAGSQRRYGTCWLASGDTIVTWNDSGLAA